MSPEFSATTLDNSLTQPVIVTEGSDALLTCVARQLGEHTVLWKYGRDKILTAGSSRITSDKRFRVLHDEGKINKDHKIDKGDTYKWRHISNGVNLKQKFFNWLIKQLFLCPPQVAMSMFCPSREQLTRILASTPVRSTQNRQLGHSTNWQVSDYLSFSTIFLYLGFGEAYVGFGFSVC